MVLSKAITVPPEKRIDANVPNACMHRQKGRIQEAIVVVGRKIMSWPVESHRRPTLVEVALCGNTETRGSTIFYMLLEWRL